MKKFSLIILIAMVLSLSGCVNVNKEFTLEFPRIDSEDYLFDKGSNTPYEDLKDAYNVVYDLARDRYRDSHLSVGALNRYDLSEDTFLDQSTIENSFLYEFKMLYPNELDAQYRIDNFMKESSRNTNIGFEWHGSFVEMILGRDDMIEGEEYQNTTDQRYDEGYYLVNGNDIYIRFHSEIQSSGLHTYSELLVTSENDKRVENYHFFQQKEMDVYSYNSTYIEDDYSYTEYYYNVDDILYYKYWYTDYKTNISDHLFIKVNGSKTEVDLMRYVAEENTVFTFNVSEANQLKTYTYLHNGEPTVEYIDYHSNEESYNRIRHNLKNVEGYDFMGGITYQDNFEYLAKDNQVIDLGEYSINSDLHSTFLLERTVESISEAQSELYEINTVTLINEFDFDIQSVVDQFNKITVEVDGLSITINGKEFDLGSRDFIESVIGTQYKEELDIVFELKE